MWAHDDWRVTKVTKRLLIFRDGICVETTQMRGRFSEREEGWGGGEGEVGDE